MTAQGWITATLCSVLSLSVLSGCHQPPYPNRDPLCARDLESGYRFDTLEPGPGNTDHNFICLTFSGGGTRAAAMSYGVLQALRDARVDSARQGSTRLLDEVDVISSVSGGSFTALSYAMQRDEFFNGRFKETFLYRNIQLHLLLNVFNPLNLLRLSSVMLDRIDIAADYYSEALFNEQTYGDLMKTNRRPYIVVNSTNMSTGGRLEFTQSDFDLLGSDLAAVPLGWAAAASSAFPFLLSPMRLKYHVNDASAQTIDALLDERGERKFHRRAEWAERLVQSEKPGEPPLDNVNATAHKYLYLLDGGLSDNLGLSHVLDSYLYEEINQRIDDRRIKRLVVIVVDAGTEPPENLESRRSAPGLFIVGYKTATISMENHSDALVARLHDLMSDRCAGSPQADTSESDRVALYLIHLSFHGVDDFDRRRRLLSLPTSFALPDDDVDELIELGGELLRDNADYQRLLDDLGAE